MNSISYEGIITLVKVYLLIISLLALILTVTDKINSKKSLPRIPEKTLFLIAFLGGSLSMLITMLIIRHKTKHLRFMIGLPVIIILHIGLILIIK